METTKERIIAHSAELFAKKGCKTITMDDIATSMGISKRTIYENFTDKKELLAACLNYFFEREDLDIKAILQSSENIIAAIFKQMDNASKVFAHLKFDFFNEIQKYFPEVYNNTVKVFKQQHLDSTEKMLQKGQRDGVVRKELNPKLMAVVIQEISNLVFSGDVFSAHGFEKKEVMPAFMGCLTRGMCTEKGVQIMEEYKDRFKECRK